MIGIPFLFFGLEKSIRTISQKSIFQADFADFRLGRRNFALFSWLLKFSRHYTARWLFFVDLEKTNTLAGTHCARNQYIASIQDVKAEFQA
ncbi:MAG: hypothetical protein LBE84_01075 [Planctomycetota bacterium]|jgi:hypothetical protein|nr:hypothetical protein [Planctomycetota bacterium]